MMFSCRFNRKRLGRVPRKTALLCVLFGIMILLLFLNLLFPETDMLNHTHSSEITINEIYQPFSGKNRSSATFIISTEECKYYFVMPFFSDEYNYFRDNVEKKLFDRQINSVSVIVTTKQTWQDRILNRYRILSLSINGVECLSIDTSKADLVSNYIGAWFAFLLIGGCFAAYIVITAICYGVLELSGKTKKKG